MYHYIYINKKLLGWINLGVRSLKQVRQMSELGEVRNIKQLTLTQPFGGHLDTDDDRAVARDPATIIPKQDLIVNLRPCIFDF